MKKQDDLVETYTVVARPYKRGGTERAWVHHFPLYSHPMFRAALRNEEAVRNAFLEQSDRIDPLALDSALDHMVTQLMAQHLDQHEAKGSTPTNTSRKDFIVTDSQLHALLAEPTHAAPLPSRPQQPSSVLQPITPETIGALAPGAAQASSSPGLQGQFIPNQYCHTTYPPLHSYSYVKHRVAPPLRTQAASLSGATSVLSSNKQDALKVVSVDALQQSALRNGEHVPNQSALRLPPLSASTTLTDSGEAKAKNAEIGASGNTTTPQHRPMASLYSLLPSLTASPGLKTSSVLLGTATSLRPSQSSLSFCEMDRRPGIGTGPVAQQSVDAQQLHRVPDAVFAAMDVYMDGNSCCIRRRQRVLTPNGNKDMSLPLNLSSLPGGRASAAGGSCFVFGCGSRITSISPTYIAAAQNKLPAPPPPRTAAEAKARCILESQRRKQRLHDQQQHLGPDSYFLTSGGDAAQRSSSFAGPHGDPVTLPTEPLRSRHRKQSDSRHFNSAHSAVLPVAPPVTCSSVAVPRTASSPPSDLQTSLLFTLRDIAGESVYTQAVSSANRFANLRLC
ncbi:hypothetical protein, conserved [Leishmania lindenbergi]|uniref:Uncharacterized protein n=1 Tax=Leishmania lindenbergi TaxID=651832 RepID=A0AAW3ADH7_9TRYP